MILHNRNKFFELVLNNTISSFFNLNHNQIKSITPHLNHNQIKSSSLKLNDNKIPHPQSEKKNKSTSINIFPATLIHPRQSYLFSFPDNPNLRLQKKFSPKQHKLLYQHNGLIIKCLRPTFSLFFPKGLEQSLSDYQPWRGKLPHLNRRRKVF
jgi:hypothetical protein